MARFVTAVVAALILVQAAQSQQPAPTYVPTSLVAEPGVPRTPEGKPDLQGIWTTDFQPVWETNRSEKSLVVSEERAQEITRTFVEAFLSSPSRVAFIDDETRRMMAENRGLPIVRGQRRTRAVVEPADGVLPLTPEARAELARANPALGQGLENPEQRPAMERCVGLQGLPPVASTLAFNFTLFVQTKDHVVIHTEYGGETRIIPFRGSHGPMELQPPMGDAIARWEGDTLIIETTGQPEEARVRPVPKMIVSAHATVIERYTRLSRDELLYQYTVLDPAVYTGPWLAEHSLYRTEKRMYEHACHEGNYSLPNILRAARIGSAGTPLRR